MKKPTKNEVDMIALMTKLQEQLVALDKKVDTLIFRSINESMQPSKQPVSTPPAVTRTNDQPKGRPMFTAVCADCKKECTIPFKPSGDRPVYCKDCFSRRKVISMSKIGSDDQLKESAPQPTPIIKPTEIAKTLPKAKKKPGTVKKTITKKRTTPKKK